MNLKGKKVLVYGMAASGNAAAKLLTRVGATVFCFDDFGGDIPTGCKRALDAERAAKECDLTVVSPSVPINTPSLAVARRAGKVISETELAYNFLNSELYAVTGTNGKTTVTLMINEILNNAGFVSYALGNIGIPMSERVLDMTPSEIAVVEVSTFQLEGCVEFGPDVAVLTNVTADHLDRHGTIESYVALKAKLFARQINRDIAVLNADDAISAEIAKGLKCDKIFFSTRGRVRGAYIEGDDIWFEDRGKLRVCALSDVPGRGRFAAENALAAITACAARGVNPEVIKMTLRAFTPPKYRLYYVGEFSGKLFYNDSKATNVAAALAAAESIEEDTILIVGGRSKGENYANLFKNLPKNVKKVFITGENAAEITEAALSVGFDNISHRATLAECVSESATDKTARAVLFAPAAASFDRYCDYRERGEAFDRLVRSLI